MVKKIGQIYRIGDESYCEYYLLSMVDGGKPKSARVCLIGLKNGNRHKNPIIVKNPDNITDVEFKELLSPYYKTELSSWKEFWGIKGKYYE